MKKRSFVDHHIIEAVRGSLAEADGNENLSRRLRAETRLRLIAMSNEELWELAKLISYPPARPVELVYRQIKQTIQAHKASGQSWVNDLGRRLPPGEENEG